MAEHKLCKLGAIALFSKITCEVPETVRLQKLPSMLLANTYVMVAFLTCWYARQELGFVPDLSHPCGIHYGYPTLVRSMRQHIYEQIRGCGIAARNFFDELIGVKSRDVLITLTCLVRHKIHGYRLPVSLCLSSPAFLKYSSETLPPNNPE